MANIQVPPAAGTSGQFLDAIIITSSSLRQIVLLGDPATSGAFATVTTSAGMAVNVTSGSISTLTSGPVTISGTVTVLSASSGLVQISGTPTILSASSGLVQTLSSGPILLSSVGVTQSIHPVISSAGFGPVTSSAGVLASLSSGTIIMSSVQSVTATAATNPWSSAPGFNIPVVSVSSGLVQTLTSGPTTISGTVTVLNASSGVVGTILSTGQTWNVYQINNSSSNSITNVQTSAVILYGWNVGNQVSGAPVAIKIYNTTSAPTIGSTTLLKITIPIPGSTAGAGNNLMLSQGVPFSAGLSFTITANFAATDTGLSGTAGFVVGQLYYI